MQFSRTIAILFFLFGPCLAMAAPVPQALDQDTKTSVVILDWQRFADPDALDDEITLLQSQHYRPVSLATVIEAFEHGDVLPERSFAITVDGNARAFASIAWPRFKAAGLPVTLFITADGDGLSYAELRALQASGVDLAPLGTGKVNPLTADDKAWAADLEAASQIFVREFGVAPAYFGWPGGLFSRPSLKGAATVKGYRAGFASFSAPASPDQPRFALPRFVLHGDRLDLQRLSTLLDSVPMRVKDVLPRHFVIKPGMKNPPFFGFTLVDPKQGISGLNCYSSTSDTPAQLIFAGRRVEVRFETPLPKGRTKIKCTMPTKDGRWSWFGRAFYVE